MSGRVAGKTAIVTGAGAVTSGIGNGRASAIVYAREGAKVLLVDCNLEAAQETERFIKNEGGECISFAADVTKSNDCQNIVQKCLESFGKVDILHNNVGVVQTTNLEDTTEEQWDKGVDLNLKSVFLMCKYTIPHMVKQGSGSVINISAMASIRYLGYDCIPYSVPKAGVNTLTQQLALHYADKGVRINAILPGFINTPLVEKALAGAYGGNIDEMIRQRDAMCPMKKMGTAWDVAYTALFLASDEAKFITGVNLLVDGGQTLKI